MAARRVVDEGLAPAQVAAVLGVHVKTVREWARAYRSGGAAALAARPHPGPGPRLSEEQQREVLSWRERPASAFGLTGDWWTAPRLARLIEERFGVAYHPRYLNAWLAERRVSPQRPAKRPRERDERAVRAWRTGEWPALVKKAGGSRFRSS